MAWVHLLVILDYLCLLPRLLSRYSCTISLQWHHVGVTMSQITNNSIVCSAACSKNASQLSIIGPLWWESTCDSHHKGPVVWKQFPWHDIIIYPAKYLKVCFDILSYNQLLEDSHEYQCFLKLLHWQWRNHIIVTVPAKWYLTFLLFFCCPEFTYLTHWSRDKVAASFLRTFSNAFSWMKISKFQLRFHWNLFPIVQLTTSQHWFR